MADGGTGTTTTVAPSTTFATAPPTAPSSLLTVGAAEINASTYTAGSFRLTNESPAGQEIASLEVDLATSLLPDLVFDPDGRAGDTTSRSFTVSGDPGVGEIVGTFSGPHDLGYDVLSASFTEFAPGKTVAFAVDVDPTTIRGAAPPGPSDTGSVSGLELTGATVTVRYEDGTTQTGQLFRSPDSQGGSEVRFASVERPSPTLEAVGVATREGAVDDPRQTLRVTAPAGTTVRLLAVEAALFRDGLPAHGFEVDPFEVNSVIAVDEHLVQVGPTGTVEVPVTLTATNPSGGNNLFVATIVSPDPATGPTSDVVTLQLAS